MLDGDHGHGVEEDLVDLKSGLVFKLDEGFVAVFAEFGELGGEMGEEGEEFGFEAGLAEDIVVALLEGGEGGVVEGLG